MVLAPVTQDALGDALMDGKALDELMNDPVKLKEWMKQYAINFYKNDPDVKQQLLESQERAWLDIAERNGYESLKDGKTVRRLPFAGESDKDPENQPIGAKLNGQFKGFGDFVKSEWFKNPHGMDSRVALAKNLGESQLDQGGALVPEEFRAELLRMNLEAALVRPRARVVPMGSLTLRYPAIRDASHASTVFGGVTAQWINEGGDLSSSTNEPTFAQAVLTAKKLSGYTVTSNELMMDSAISIESILMQLFGEAIPYFEDDAFLVGQGAGQPVGVLNADALVAVAKETGQAANTIVWENIVKMFSRMLPQSISRAIWYAHIDTFPQLATMSLNVGTGGAAIWINNGVAGPPATILGRPVFFTEKAETVGTAGDIVFSDFSYYLIGDRQALTIESSPHVQFINDRTVWRFIQRVDGRPWIDTALTPRNGTNTLSPFVDLAVRA